MLSLPLNLAFEPSFPPPLANEMKLGGLSRASYYNVGGTVPTSGHHRDHYRVTFSMTKIPKKAPRGGMLPPTHGYHILNGASPCELYIHFMPGSTKI